MLYVAIVSVTLVLSGVFILAIERRWKPKSRLYWGLIPFILSPLVTLILMKISQRIR